MPGNRHLVRIGPPRRWLEGGGEGEMGGEMGEGGKGVVKEMHLEESQIPGRMVSNCLFVRHVASS